MQACRFLLKQIAQLSEAELDMEVVQEQIKNVTLLVDCLDRQNRRQNVTAMCMPCRIASHFHFALRRD